MKWILSDIDGTLLDANGTISAYTKQVLIDAQMQGIGLVLASGRSPQSMRPYVDALKIASFSGLGICYNGALLHDYKANTSIYSKVIAQEQVHKHIVMGKEIGLEMAVYYEDQVYSESINPKLTGGYYKQDPAKPRIYYNVVEDLASLVSDAHKIGCYLPDPAQYEAKILAMENPFDFVRVNAHWMEINPPCSDKGYGLQSLCAYVHANPQDVYVFGDGENDIPMFQKAVHAIAVENAFPSLKEFATAYTAHHAQDGVAKYVCEHIARR